jgi:hypothetical protein
MTTAMTAAFRPEALDGRRRAPGARRDAEPANTTRQKPLEPSHVNWTEKSGPDTQLKWNAAANRRGLRQ